MRRFYNVWILVGIAHFYFGPIDWPGSKEPTAAIVVLSSLAGFNIGAAIEGRRKSVVRPSVLDLGSRTLAVVVVAIHAVLSLVFLTFSTGRSVLSAANYGLDFGAAYDSYAQISQQVTLSPEQQGLLLIKAALFPFVLVAFVKYFRRDRLIVALFLGPLIVSSLFRGTDKEMADLLLIVAVCAGLYGLLSVRRILFGLLALLVVMYLFVLRRLGRYGGDLPACLPGSGTCFNYQSFIAERFGDHAEVFNVFASSYLTNGYQGLTLATQLPWHGNFGIGHLPIVKTATCALSQAVCSMPDYQQSLTATGWDARARWTSVYTVLANDFTFWLVPVYFLVLGLAFQKALNAWATTKDATAGATIVVVTMFIVYSSANMQIAITFDWAAATIMLLYVMPWRRGARQDNAVASADVT